MLRDFNSKYGFIKRFFYKYKFVWGLLFKTSGVFFSWVIVSTIIRGVAPYLITLAEKNLVLVLETASSLEKVKLAILLNCAVLFLFYLLRAVFFNFSIALYRILGLELNHEIKKSITDKIQKIPYSKFYDKDFLNLHSAVTKSGSFDALNVIRTLFSGISVCFSFCLAAQAIGKYNLGYLAILVLGFVLAGVAKIRLGNREFASAQRCYAVSREHGTLFNYMTSGENAKDIRVFNSYSTFKSKLCGKFWEELSIWKKHSFFAFKVDSFFQAVSQAGSFWVVLDLAFKALTKSIYISDFIFYSSLIFSLQNIVSDFLENIYQNYTSMLFLDSFFKFMKTEEVGVSLGAIKHANQNLVAPFCIEFRDVSFRYAYSQHNALSHVSCCFKAGEPVCIVGRNGSGKTTLVNLILRLYEPTSGEILLNGVDIRHYDLKSYYSIFSVFFQETMKYHFKIGEYVALGCEDFEILAGEERLRQAANQADAADFIEKLPKRYSTFLTKKFHSNGFEPSGGQWQKLGLARTFFSNKGVLIFDEPTSSMDVVSEKRVYGKILEAQKDQTKIFISHKIQYIANSQKVLFLKEGKVEGFSCHQKLLESNEEYRKFCGSF